MTQFRHTLNGETVFDGDLGEYVRVPPDFVKGYLKPGVGQEDWQKHVMIALTDAIQQNKAMEVAVLTISDEWHLIVTPL